MRTRQGVILLEAMLSLALLAIAATSFLTMATAAQGAVRAGARAEEYMSGAARLMDAASLWTRSDLERHLGARREGAWLMTIQRPQLALFHVTIADSTGRHELLRTTLFRREP